MNPALTHEVAQTGVFAAREARNPVRFLTMPRKSSESGAPATTRGSGKMNPLQRLIRSRMSELDITFREVAQRGGLPWSTVSALANKTEHRSVPRRGTLEKLAKGLGLPADLVSAAAAESAGLNLQEIPITLESSEDVRIVVASMGKMTAADRAKLRRLAEAFRDEVDAEEGQQPHEQGG